MSASPSNPSSKPALRLFYLEQYRKFAECLAKCPKEGVALELGSGEGFIKEAIPDVLTSDIKLRPGVDLAIDARALPFRDGELRGVFLLDAFHHIADAGQFLSEVTRCLAPGGRVLIVDQHRGWINEPILRFFHREPFLPGTKTWTFDSSDPEADANAALAWVVFQRDQALFESKYPRLRLLSYRPHSPLVYWLTGGLKKWSLLTAGTFAYAAKFDQLLMRTSSRWGTFVDIELVKTCPRSHEPASRQKPLARVVLRTSLRVSPLLDSAPSSGSIGRRISHRFFGTPGPRASHPGSE